MQREPRHDRVDVSYKPEQLSVVMRLKGYSYKDYRNVLLAAKLFKSKSIKLANTPKT